MLYRRFGRTELQMPVITCGGMRYQQSWSTLPPEEITSESQKNLEATVRRALELGINHIETARGYGSSEQQLGLFLPDLPRDEMIVQTKVSPQDSADEFLKVFDTSMAGLQLDYVDLLAFHGVNDHEVLDKALHKGNLEAARRLFDEGRIRHLGFSSHAYSDVLVKAIETDEFDYLNLHYYYIDQANDPALRAAAAHDMGVLIISPCDKAGQLFNPPEKLARLCEPLTPMGFNDLFCLQRPEIHTLTIGASCPENYDAHVEIVPQVAQAAATVAPIVARLEAAKEEVFERDWIERWEEGVPAWDGIPGGVNAYQMLRLYNLARAFDMVEFGKYRYNLLGSGGHWFPGYKLDEMDWDKLPEALSGSPFAERIPDILREADKMFAGEDKKRLSES